MAWVTLTHTQRRHAHRDSAGTGHVYQGRFKSFPVQEDEHFYTVCRYVERNALRAKLVVSDRMVSIGTLAAGVAHEINNPLTYVSASLDALRDLLRPAMARDAALAEATSLLDDMRDGIDRVGRTVRDLKLFSRSEVTLLVIPAEQDPV